MKTQGNVFTYLHCSVFSPVISTWVKAIDEGYFPTCPGLTSTLVQNYLEKSMTTAKVNLRQYHKHIHFNKNPPKQTPDVMTPPESTKTDSGVQ